MSGTVSKDEAVTDPWADVPYYAAADEFATGWELPPREPLTERVRRHATPFFAAALLLPLLGAPVALLWRAVTPRVGFVRTASGPQSTAGETDQFFAIEGWFVVVTVAAGLLLGVLAWRLLRGRGPFGALGLALGGLAASGVAAIVGSRLVLDSYIYDYCRQPGFTCDVYDGTLTLRAPVAIVAWPTAMLLTFAVLTLVRDRDEGW